MFVERTIFISHVLFQNDHRSKKSSPILILFCTLAGIKKKQKIWVYYIFRKNRLKIIYSGTHFSSFLDFRLILYITAQTIFAVEPSAGARWKGISIDHFTKIKNKKNNNNNIFCFTWGY
jgi:hypothetical protein